MTLVEFLAPLRHAPSRDRCLAVIYFKRRYEGVESMTSDQIRAALSQCRVPKAKFINVADVLSKAGPLIDSPGVQGMARVWKLTALGELHIRKLMQLPEAEPELEHDVGYLKRLAQSMTNSVVRAYIDEAVDCLSVGALRAAIVFLWSGAVRTLQEKVLTAGAHAVNIAVQSHDPKARLVRSLDDFQYVKDSTLLLVAQDVGVLDKAERTTLDEALGLRNKSGHPNKYDPGIKKASSFIEDITGIVFH